LAAFNKFNLFSEDLCRGVHNFQSGGATYAVMLTNTAPVATNHLYGDISANELAAGGGYTVGGITSAMADRSTGGVESVTATNVTWTASGGGIGPFRYVVVYNQSQTTPLKPLVCWFDYGSSITLNGTNGDTFTVNFGAGFFTAT
jgi:hypothetical protein